MLVNPKILQWIQSVKEGLNISTSPNWTTIAKNIAKKYEYKPRKCSTSSMAQFWAHLYPPSSRICQHLSVGLHTLVVITETPTIRRTTTL